jgi:ubiquinone/menaquinone biosynthesis C-methylase UbiE
VWHGRGYDRRVERRYDGVADWYDAYVTGDRGGLTELARTTLLEFLGGGPGRCLDVGCGGAVQTRALVDAGWTVVGLDESADQLRVAASRVPEAELVRADAASLPFPDATFDAVALVFVHTDVNDLRAVAGEAARVLRPGGRLVLVGTHPCFVGPFAERTTEGATMLHSGYREESWTAEGPGLGPGIRRRVGVHHVTLATLLQAFVAAGLSLERVVEPGDDEPPALLAFAASR